MTIVPAAILFANLLLTNVTWNGNPYSGVLLNGYYYTLDLWNLKSANGSLWIKVYQDNVFEIFSNLRNVKLKNPSLTVVGYPDAIYGHSIWYNITTNGEYPVQLSNIKRITLNLAYISIIDRCPSDVAIDIWLTKNKDSKIGSKDVELMIWLYKNNFSPRGHIIGYIHYKSINWSIWLDQDKWVYVAFVPSKNVGHIKINLNKFIKYLEKMGMVDKFYWLNDIDFGVEFGKNDKNMSIIDFILYYNVNQTIK